MGVDSDAIFISDNVAIINISLKFHNKCFSFDTVTVSKMAKDGLQNVPEGANCRERMTVRNSMSVL